MRWWETRWYEKREDGWHVYEVGGGWSEHRGPYKCWLTAILVWYFS